MPQRAQRYRDDPTVSAVIPTYDPNPEHLAWSLDSLTEQTKPPDEIIIVDASKKAIDADADGIATKVLDGGGLGISDARERGVEEATGEYILDMDEDAVFVSEEYIERAVDELSKPGVAAAGGVVHPIRGNMEGKAIAALDRLNPSDLGTHYLVYPRWQCETGDGNACYPVDHRGEDVAMRNRLNGFGEIRRMEDQPALKDLPTTRQEGGRNTILLGIVGGIVTSVVVSALEKPARRVGTSAFRSVRESLSGAEAGN